MSTTLSSRIQLLSDRVEELKLIAEILKRHRRQTELQETNRALLTEINAFGLEIEQNQAHEQVVDVLFENEEICIVNKPPNVRIDGDEHITVERLTLNTLQSRGIDKVRHCHQLDRGTSGCLVYALSRAAAAQISALFKQRTVRKFYCCIVCGHVKRDHFLIDFPIVKRKYKQSIGDDADPGKAAMTKCTVIKRGFMKGIAVSLLTVRLHTGRRHQIRLHLSECAHPIIGDPIYWRTVDGLRFKQMRAMFDRMYLDSHRIVLPLESGLTIDVSTHMQRRFAAFIEMN